MKKLKLRIVKFERALAMQVLEIFDFDISEHVRRGRTDFAQECIYLGKEPHIGLAGFPDNAARDAYLQKVLGWISEELFGGVRTLEIGKECLVSEDGKEWTQRIYAGKVAKQLGMDKRYLARSNSEEDGFLRWRYAKPINDCLKVEGEIYTWEDKQ